MIKIAITEAAFDAIARHAPAWLGGYEKEINERGERPIWLKDEMAVLGFSWSGRLNVQTPPRA